MRIRVRITVDIGPSPAPPDPLEPHETFESQGSLVEHAGQPRYVGFAPAGPPEEIATKKE